MGFLETLCGRQGSAFRTAQLWGELLSPALPTLLQTTNQSCAVHTQSLPRASEEEPLAGVWQLPGLRVLLWAASLEALTLRDTCGDTGAWNRSGGHHEFRPSWTVFCWKGMVGKGSQAARGSKGGTAWRKGGVIKV